MILLHFQMKMYPCNLGLNFSDDAKNYIYLGSDSAYGFGGV